MMSMIMKKVQHKSDTAIIIYSTKQLWRLIKVDIL